ncbi:MAG TPA: hypothetical protein VHG28_14950 [Longimicrobiaceae bacterium]|nr:hypothetical protein [Longimicrobiaceae bacterium]
MLPHDHVLSELDALGLSRQGMRLRDALRRLSEWQAGSLDDAAPALAPPERDLREMHPGLQIPLRALDRLLREPDPDDPTLEAVAFACLNVAIWAEERGAHRTALGFLQAAEDVYPDNPYYAYNIGRLARKMALYEEAEAWLKWAHFGAHGERKWEVATLSLSGLGNLHRQRGNLPRARRFHEVARRMARRHDLRTLEGDALYDLAIMSFDFGDPALGLDYARKALKAYGPGHGQIHHLAHDIAWIWMDSFGRFESAARVFLALLDHIWLPATRLLVCANLARASSGAGWREAFEEMWIQTWTMIRSQVSCQGHAAALVQLALGAGNLGDWERAGKAASEASSIASRRREEQVLAAAKSILESLHGGMIRDETLMTVFKDRKYMSSQPGMTEEVEEFAVQLACALRARWDGAPESPTRAFVLNGRA